MKFLCEIEVATDSHFVSNVGNGVFEMNLPQIIPVPCNKTLKIGVKKDIKIPKKRKAVDFGLLLCPKQDVFDKKSLKKFQVNYSSNEELALFIESVAKASLDYAKNTSLDFSYPAGVFKNSFSFDLTRVDSFCSMEYKCSRFIFEVHKDFHLIITPNLCRLLGFDDAIISSYTEEEIIYNIVSAKILVKHFVG